MVISPLDKYQLTGSDFQGLEHRRTSHRLPPLEPKSTMLGDSKHFTQFEFIYFTAVDIQSNTATAPSIYWFVYLLHFEYSQL